MGWLSDSQERSHERQPRLEENESMSGRRLGTGSPGESHTPSRQLAKCTPSPAQAAPGSSACSPPHQTPCLEPPRPLICEASPGGAEVSILYSGPSLPLPQMLWLPSPSTQEPVLGGLVPPGPQPLPCTSPARRLAVAGDAGAAGWGRRLSGARRWVVPSTLQISSEACLRAGFGGPPGLQPGSDQMSRENER